MPAHVGRRRRPPDYPLIRLLPLVVAVLAILRLLTLPEPRGEAAAPSSSAAVVTPSAQPGAATVSLAGRLPDATPYTPRLVLTATASIGQAQTSDGDWLRVVLVSGKRVTELRRVSTATVPQFDGFTRTGDTVVWAETVSPAGGAARSMLWKANWRTGSQPVLITTSMGEAAFYGSEYDLIIRSGRVYWTATVAGSSPASEVRSISLTGGQLSIQRLAGQYALTAWPWAVSRTGGRGTPVQLVNLTTNATITIPTSAPEIATCSPSWCRMGVLGDSTLARIDLLRTTGDERRRIAGAEATPAIADVALLNRFVPLQTDPGDGSGAAGLSVYDIDTGETSLVATPAANISGRGAMLWWSTGTGAGLVWHVLDLSGLT